MTTNKDSPIEQQARFNFCSFNGRDYILSVTSRQMSFNFLRGLTKEHAKLAVKCFQRILCIVRYSPDKLNELHYLLTERFDDGQQS